MKALVKEQKGPGFVGLSDAAIPTTGAGQVKIAVEAAGICGTDVHIMHDTFPYIPPVIMGHEFSGRITEVGSGVEGLAPGDRVMAETTAVLCGECAFCYAGQTNLCPARRAYGIHLNGGFAESVVVRKEAIHRLPANVDFNMGAMTEPLAVVVRALTERTHISTGQLVLVMGPGTIGLLAALLAKAHGATVIVAGTSKDKVRLELAQKLGIDRVVAVESEDLWQTVESLAKGRGGADITVEAAGAVRSVEAAYKCTRKGGTIVQLGLFEGPISIDYSQIPFREFNIIGSFAHTWSSFESALNLMDKNVVDVRPLISAVLPLDDWENGFRRAESGDGVKILFAPQQ
jgi:L-iditol 2-dehydrogenase